MTELAVFWDAPARTRLSGFGATNVIPMSLTQGTRRLYESIVSNVTHVPDAADTAVAAGSHAGTSSGLIRGVLPPDATRSATDTQAVATEDFAASGTRAGISLATSQRYVLGRLEEMLHATGAELGVSYDLSVVTRAWTEGMLLLDETTPTPSVIPSEDRGVTFVWHKGGWDVELEIDPIETTVWAHSRRTGETWFGALDAHRQDLRQLLREMTVE